MTNKNPIDDYTVSVDTNGVLDTLVKQPYDNSPSEDSSGLHYNEKFKGPYAKTKEVLTYIKAGDALSAVHSALSSHIGLSEQITYPTCPTRNGVQYQWLMTGARVEEIDAGAHCYLYLDYSAQIQSESELTPDPWQDTWSITWQSYSVDPYAFVSNKPNQAYPVSPSFDVDPDLAKPPASWDKSAMRVHIDKYLNSLADSKKVDNKTYYYYTPDPTVPDVRYFLNDTETEVMKKKQLGRSATYHYPIVTHQTVMRGPVASNYQGTVGDGIDYIVDTLSGCPYTFPLSTWTWIKIGDDMQQVKVKASNQTTFTRKETFAGFTAVDINFYGNGAFNHTEAGILSGRWKIGEI